MGGPDKFLPAVYAQQTYQGLEAAAGIEPAPSKL